MDVILEFADKHVLDAAWSKALPDLALGRESVVRQMVSLYVLTLVGIFILYFGIAGASYAFIFDKRMMKHPRFLKNQIRREIKMSVTGFPVLDLMTLPWFLGEVRGYSKMYMGIENSPFGHGTRGGIAYIICSSALFLWFTDLLIYLVHRILHWPSVYKVLHKPHHKWVIPTPFASHAFHPIDGYLQSLPYHMFVFIFPLHKYTYLGLFVFVNLWSIFIHDSDMIVGHPLESIINGPAHHTLHHMYFVYNYGQYFTWADKVGGSYKHPVSDYDPLIAVLSREEAKAKLQAEKAALVAQEQEEKRQAQAQAEAQPESRNTISRTVSICSSVPMGQTASDSGVENSSGHSESDEDSSDEVRQASSTAGKSKNLRRRK